MPIVADASVTIAWCFEDEANSDTDSVLDRLRDEEAVVTALWQREVTDVLLAAVRRGRITEAQSTRFLDLLSQLRIRVDISQIDMKAVQAIGRRHQLSAYDAACRSSRNDSPPRWPPVTASSSPLPGPQASTSARPTTTPSPGRFSRLHGNKGCPGRRSYLDEAPPGTGPGFEGCSPMTTTGSTRRWRGWSAVGTQIRHLARRPTR